MIVRDQDPFFGSIGAMASQFAGLTAPGMSGASVPLFRSNIFDRRDPRMSGLDYVMSDIYSRRLNDIAAGYQRQLSRSMQSLFNENSALGSFFYEKNGAGNHVQAPGTINAFNAFRNFATSSIGSSIINNSLNNLLGYDRGAGINVFAQQADAILNRSAGYQRSLYRRNAAGQAVYIGDDPTTSNYQANRAIAARALDGSLQRVMYSDGLMKDWSVSHGISEGLAARIISDAAKGGMYDQGMTMSEEDRERTEKIANINDQIREEKNKIDNAKYRIGLVNRGVTSDVRIRSGAAEDIESAKKRIDELEKQRGELQDEITTFDFDTTFDQVISGISQSDADAQRQMREATKPMRDELVNVEKEIVRLTNAYDISSGTAESEMLDKTKLQPLRDRARNLAAQIDEKEKETSGMEKTVEGLEKKLDPVTKLILKEVSAAVDSAKTMFGGAEEAYDTLYKMTNGSISQNLGTARHLNMQLQEYQNTGMLAGMTNEQLGAMLQASVGSVAGARRVHPAYQNDVYSTSLGLRAASAAARMQNAEGLTESERQIMGDSAVWLAQTNDQSTLMNAANMLRLSYEEGDMDKTTYNQLAIGLQSSSDSERAAAYRKFVSIAFGGNMAAANMFLNNEDMMAIVRDRVKNKDAVLGIQEASARNETYATKELAAASNELEYAENFARQNGVGSEQILRTRNQASVEGFISAINDAAYDDKGNVKDKDKKNVLDAFNEYVHQLRASGKSSEEVNSEAVAWMESVGYDALGGYGVEARKRVLNNITSKLNEESVGRELLGSVSDKMKAVLAYGDSGKALNENGRFTSDALMKLGSATFSNTTPLLRLDGERGEKFRELKQRYDEAIENQNYEAAQEALQGYMDNMLEPELGMLGSTVSRTVSFDKKTGPGRAFKTVEDAARALRARGEDVNVVTLNGMIHSEALQAETDKDAAMARKKRIEGLKDRAYKHSEPGAESIASFLGGKGSFVNIFKNSGVDDNVFYDSVSRLFEDLGFASGDASSMAFLDAFTGGGPKSVSTKDFGQSFFNAILKGTEKRDEDLAVMFGVRDQKNFTEQAKKLRDAKTDEERQEAAKQLVKEARSGMSKRAKNLVGKSGLTDDERQELESLRLTEEKFGEVESMNKKGQFDLRGKDDTGGSKTTEGKIDDLIEKIGKLIEALNRQPVRGSIMGR